MGDVLHAIAVFFEQLASVEFTALGLAIACHFVKTLCTARAWRNTIAVAYPGVEVPYRPIYASYLAAVGVNALVPARGGDAVRLYLAHRAVPGATYTTLASSLFVLSIFDMSAAGALFVYALTLGVLPGFGSLGGLPGFDFGFVTSQPELTLALLLAFAILGAVGVAWLRLHWAEFKQRAAQGIAVLGDRPLYLRRVAVWQAADWSMRFAAIWFFLDAFGVEQSLRNILLVQVTQSLATLIPISPGGIGTEQAFIVVIFKGSVATTQLLAFSVGMKLTLITVNIVLGFAALFFTLGHTNWRSLAGAKKTPEDAATRG